MSRTSCPSRACAAAKRAATMGGPPAAGSSDTTTWAIFMSVAVESTMTLLPAKSSVPAAARPAIAIIANSQTPYRLHLHRRIAAEIPQVQLWSLYTHETSNSAWAFEAPPEIGPVLFGKGESSAD